MDLPPEEPIDTEEKSLTNEGPAQIENNIGY